MRKFLGPVLLIVACLLISASTEVIAARPDPVGVFFDTIRARLALMDDVATYKYKNSLPVEDRAREAQVLASAVDAAARHGLDPASVAGFFRAQIKAAKAIQSARIGELKRAEPPQQLAVRDLQSDLRPELMRTGGQIVAQLAIIWPLLAGLDDAALDTRLVPLGLSVDMCREIVASLRAVRPALASISVLDQVAARKIIRVGTTGDYAPFSLLHGDTYSGIDITLARHLAGTLDAQVEFVATTWPTLLADLRAGKFDIAMSGISRKLFRQRVGYLSEAYHRGGKTPIIRCQDLGTLNTLENIDRAGIRVIVNPGGTNERFVRATIKHAQIMVHNDNRAIFDLLAQGHADVMFTDAIEVAYQSKHNEALCPAMAGKTLTFSEKSFLLPRDEPWLHYVNTWLHEITQNGTLEHIFDTY